MKEIYLVNIFQNIDCDASKKKAKQLKLTVQHKNLDTLYQNTK